MPGSSAPSRILILGGTREAREIAAELIARGHGVVSSLAGVTETPVLPPGDVRRGGFGGAEGLADYLGSEGIALVVDATHPFALRMSQNADAACRAAGLPLLRFARPAWQEAEGDRWISAASAEEAAATLPQGARALVTIGRKEIAVFFARSGISGVARMIEPPDVAPPSGWNVVRERPPFTLQAELQLLRANDISHLVTKNAGGTETRAKLAAARQLHVPVVMIDRPEKPAAPCFARKSDLIRAVERVLSP